MEKDNSKEEKTVPQKRSWGKRIMRGVMFIALLFVLLMGIITILFQFKIVQNWAGKKLTEKLSQDLDTRVEFDRIEFEIFDKLVLDSFYLEDFNGDTLLFSEKLVVNFNSSLFNLLQSNLEVSDLTLQNAQLKLKRKEGEPKSNLNQLLAKLFPPKVDKKKGASSRPFFIGADVLYLENVTFENDDEVKGERVNVFIKNGEIKVDKIDLVENIVSIHSVNFEDSYVQVDLKDRKPIPKDTSLVEALEELVEVDLKADSLNKPFQLLIHDFDFGNGKLSLHNYRKSPVKTTSEEELDFDHLEAFDIKIGIDSFAMSEMVFTGKLNQFGATETSGFVLENLSSPDVKITSRKTELNGVNLVTPYSHIQDTIIFKHRDFTSYRDFENKVNMDLKFEESRVAIRDVMAFVPKLKNNKLFVDNAEELIRLDGIVKGRVNNLRGEDLKLMIGSKSIIEGDFSSRDLAKKGNESLNLNLRRLQTDVWTLRQLVPNFNPPDNFNKLGNINFKGRFDGFFVDFVAYGDLKTDLGSATMDMRLDLKDGREGAKYTGNLNLVDFDLKTWTSNDQLGNITVTSKISDGVGISASTARAKIEATVDSFAFRNYNYHDFKMDGRLTQNLFDGDFIIKDKNIDLSFDGSVDFSDTIPVFDFKADIKTLNLDELNLMKQDFGITGKMDLEIRDIDISNVEGNAQFSNLVFQRNGTEKYEIDTLSFSSIFGTNRQRIVSVSSEMLEGEITGEFDIQEIPDAFFTFTKVNYPEIAERLNIKPKRDSLKSKDFDYDITLFNSKNFTFLIDPKLDTIKNFNIGGHYDGVNYIGNVEVNLEEVTYDNVEIGGIKFNTSTNKSIGSVNSKVPFYAIINGKNRIPEIDIDAELNRDTVVFKVGLVGERGTYDRFNVAGKIFFEDGGFNVSLFNDSLVVFGEEWEISETNFIQLGRKYLETENFTMTNRNRIVSIEDINKKGIHLKLENFNTGFIDSIWNYRQMDFAGKYSVDVTTPDIYNIGNINALVKSDTFFVNGDDWGKLELNANLVDLKSQLTTKLSIQRGLRELNLDGYVILPTTKKMSGKNKEPFNKKLHPSNYFNANLDLLNYPLNILEYFIGQHASDTDGLVDLNASISGIPKQEIKSSGNAKIYKGAITVDYLNTRSFFGQETPTAVKILDNFFDFSGNTFSDKYGNIANVTGGIVHTNFRFPGLSARLFSDRLLVLDTEKTNNPLYYGHAIGEVDAVFSGKFTETDLTINAKTGKDSELFIPITYSTQNSSEISFIEFRTEDEDGDGKLAKEIRGMEIRMNVEMTEEAEVSLIIDERAGDIIRGKGNGYLQMFIPRDGDITLFGEYVIAEGDYLFTLYNIVNKKFKVKSGGTINWSGDPFGAIINLNAKYDRLSTAVYNFILEYIELGDDDLKAQSRQPTNVDLEMELTGDLLKPDINFDISFPRLTTGTVKNYVDTKLRVLRQDQSELNRQVFGLIVIGGFIPSGQENLSDFDWTSSGINTVSEYLTTRVSLYITNLLSDAFSEVGGVSGVDFDFAYNTYQTGELDLEGGQTTALAGSEVAVNLNPRFLNDQLSVSGGVVRSTETVSGTFYGSDFVAEYYLTENRRFKVRFYQRSEQALDGNRNNRMGIGLNYRRQFNTFEEFFDGLKKDAKKTVKKKPNG
jgi:hypothetical protein